MNPELPAEPIAQKEVNIRQAIMQGGLWIFFARWSMRGIGIVSTVILARLLAPEDFGLVAICLLLVGLAETIGKEGQNLAVIRRQNLDREYVDSAWTASIITGVVLGIIVVSLAPLFAKYFNEPRAIVLIYILSVRVFIMGFQNIGNALNRKNFNFGKDFLFNFLEKIIPSVFTIIAAYYLRNYWALVFGAILGYAGAIIASYMLFDYRPRICFKHIVEVWSFSIWVVAEKFAFFSTMRIDQFFVPAVGNATELGHYHVGSELARMPVVELFMPIDRVLVPAYARLLSEPKELANTYLNTLAVAIIICLPVSIGFAMVASDAVQLIYGANWIPMIPVVELIAISSFAVAIISTITPVLQVLGKSRMSAALIYLQALLLLGGLLIFQARFENIDDIAWVRLAAAMLTLPVALICVRNMIMIRYIEMLKVFWRPAIAVSVMILVLLFVLPQDMETPILVRLILRIAAGGLAYASSLMLLWLVAGKPPGAERALSRLVTERLGSN